MRAILVSIALAFSAFAWGQASEIQHPDARVEARLKTLAEELRCLVCQNQTIADSSAPLAVDLRNQIRTQITQGRSDSEIRAYMVDRYGDFVLYRPPFKLATALLWIGPFVLLALGVGVIIQLTRRGGAAAPVGSDARAGLDHDAVERLLEAGNPNRGK